jgi:hypothetical protein
MSLLCSIHLLTVDQTRNERTQPSRPWEMVHISSCGLISFKLCMIDGDGDGLGVLGLMACSCFLMSQGSDAFNYMPACKYASSYQTS